MQPLRACAVQMLDGFYELIWNTGPGCRMYRHTIRHRIVFEAGDATEGPVVRLLQCRRRLHDIDYFSKRVIECLNSAFYLPGIVTDKVYQKSALTV